MPFYEDTDKWDDPDEVLNPRMAKLLTDRIIGTQGTPGAQRAAIAEVDIRVAVYAARKADDHAAASAAHDAKLVEWSRALVIATTVLAVATIVLAVVTAMRR